MSACQEEIDALLETGTFPAERRKVNIPVVLASISYSGRVMYTEFCLDLTEEERRAILPYLQWVDREMQLTPSGRELVNKVSN